MLQAGTSRERSLRVRDTRGARLCCELESVATLLAYWLIPSADCKRSFEQTIRSLAAECDAPVFEPHVTIYAGAGGGVDSPGRILEEAVRDAGSVVAPMSLCVERVGFSEKFTKTLF